MQRLHRWAGQFKGQCVLLSHIVQKLVAQGWSLWSTAPCLLQAISMVSTKSPTTVPCLTLLSFPPSCQPSAATFRDFATCTVCAYCFTVLPMPGFLFKNGSDALRISAVLACCVPPKLSMLLSCRGCTLGLATSRGSGSWSPSFVRSLLHKDGHCGQLRHTCCEQ